jgi:hypothetical protein
VQDAYSLRCIPQVHGAVRDPLAAARRTFSIELNSATDNPLVFGEELLSGGNFHGQPLALQMDYMAITMATLAGISERRGDRLVNPALNEGLPPFLAGNAGLESGLMMVQVTAAALAAENRVLATPASPGSITTSGGKQDYVSMGQTAALKLQQAVRNTGTVLAIEAGASIGWWKFVGESGGVVGLDHFGASAPGPTKKHDCSNSCDRSSPPPEERDVAKSPAQLDAEIADALSGSKRNGFRALITRIETAIDAHPELTRERKGGRGVEEAELTFRHGKWSAKCGCRNKLAQGRGRNRTDAVYGEGDTPEEAVDNLVEMIPFWAEKMK